MTQGCILHLLGWDSKFVPPFREYIHKHFSDTCQKFIIYGDLKNCVVSPSSDTTVYPSLLKNALALSVALHKAEKIFLHGLFNNHLLYILALQPWVLKKCYWVIWGGDLYIHETPVKNWRWYKNEFFRRLVIKRLGYLVTYIEGDVELARKWYQASGVYKECIMYTSNLFREREVPNLPHNRITIQIGNSADPSNNHHEILERLLPFRDKQIAIYAPLSYGDREHAQAVIKAGVERFGEKFIPMTEFIPYDEYLKFLGTIDIAIFNHERQQAMGNTITLLGLGKKVCMRDDTTSSVMLRKLGLKIFSVSDLDLSKLDDASKLQNQSIINSTFCEKTLITQLKALFEE